MRWLFLLLWINSAMISWVRLPCGVDSLATKSSSARWRKRRRSSRRSRRSRWEQEVREGDDRSYRMFVAVFCFFEPLLEGGLRRLFNAHLRQLTAWILPGHPSSTRLFCLFGFFRIKCSSGCRTLGPFVRSYPRWIQVSPSTLFHHLLALSSLICSFVW